MPGEYDTKMNEGGARGTKRPRSQSLKGENTESKTGIKSDPSVDGITKRLAALSSLKRVSAAILTKQLEVAVPRKGKNQVEYFPMEYAEKKFAGTDINLNKCTKLMTDTVGPTQPLPQAYDSIPVKPGLRSDRKREARKNQWAEWGKYLGLPDEPNNGKNNKWKKLARSDTAAWYETPDGWRRTHFSWKNPKNAGRDLPELRITVPSTNERKSRTLGVWRNDPMLGGIDNTYDLAEKFGADKVEIKSANHCFDSIADLNKNGAHEAERRFQYIKGNEIRYNPFMPDLVVQHEDHLISIADIREKALWEAQPMLAQLDRMLDKSPRALRIGMSSREGDYLHNPRWMQKLDEGRFEEICKTYKLSPGELSKNGKFLQGSPVWVQIGENVFRDGEAVKKELPPGKHLSDVYDGTQVMIHQIENGEINSGAKIIYAANRDGDPISPEVAGILGIEARTGTREAYQQKASENQEQALADGYASSSSQDVPVKQEPNAARQSLVKGRQGQESHGIS